MKKTLWCMIVDDEEGRKTYGKNWWQEVAASLFVHSLFRDGDREDYDLFFMGNMYPEAIVAQAMNAKSLGAGSQTSRHEFLRSLCCPKAEAVAFMATWLTNYVALDATSGVYFSLYRKSLETYAKLHHANKHPLFVKMTAEFSFSHVFPRKGEKA